MAGSRRNYKAMLTSKLQQCVHELELGRGDAYRRCVNKGGDPAVDLAIAQGELRDRGLQAPSAPRPRPTPPAPEESYESLIERIEAITGLNARRASVIAAAFPEGTSPGREQIELKAEALYPTTQTRR